MSLSCVCCRKVKEVHIYAREGPICRTCLEKASTRVEIIWIDGTKFHVTRKGAAERLAGLRSAG